METFADLLGAFDAPDPAIELLTVRLTEGLISAKKETFLDLLAEAVGFAIMVTGPTNPPVEILIERETKLLTPPGLLVSGGGEKLLEIDTPDGNGTDGDGPDGCGPEGDVSDGNGPDGEEPEGCGTEGDATDGDEPEGCGTELLAPAEIDVSGLISTLMEGGIETNGDAVCWDGGGGSKFVGLAEAVGISILTPPVELSIVPIISIPNPRKVTVAFSVTIMRLPINVPTVFG
mmetsp:Transcript_93017/g.139622  ORF Transcript_93017/g.139622 Transcript_93017/m.139622 type:complete len:232 (-) Transcript_93017:94-789(-)